MKKYRIVLIGVKSDWKDGLRTAVYETCMYGGKGCTPSINGGAIHSMCAV